MMPEAPALSTPSLHSPAVQCVTLWRRGGAAPPAFCLSGRSTGLHWQVYTFLFFIFLFCFANCLIFDINDIIKPFFLEAKCYKSSFRWIIIKFGSQRTRSVKNFVITLKSNSITSVRFCKTLYTSPKSRVTSFKKKKQIRFYQQNDINIFCIYRENKFDLPENSIN